MLASLFPALALLTILFPAPFVHLCSFTFIPAEGVAAYALAHSVFFYLLLFFVRGRGRADVS